jgi:hypothetical protein
VFKRISNTSTCFLSCNFLEAPTKKYLQESARFSFRRSNTLSYVRNLVLALSQTHKVSKSNGAALKLQLVLPRQEPHQHYS